MIASKLIIPRPPGVIRSPDFDDVQQAFANPEYFGGSIMDVYLSCRQTAEGSGRRLWFWLKSENEIASFYQGDGWWAYSGGKDRGEDLMVDDGGGNDVAVNSRFLHPKSVALEFCREFLESSKVRTEDGWEKITYKSFR